MSQRFEAVKPGLVSIIIPTYRRALEMRNAALSALAQTYEQIEVIVVSDGPEPTARAAVEGIDPRLRYIELECEQRTSRGAECCVCARVAASG